MTRRSRRVGPLSMPNRNLVWAALLFEEFRRLGLKHVVVSPGSRSAPLALAAEQASGLRITVAHDERGAGFVALGIARSTGLPAAVVTTSGTAVANLLPAAVEAAMRCTPMLLITADRPPELRARGANQTIRQPGMFGNYTRWAVDLPCPSAEAPLTVALATADEAWRHATGAQGGPVHLNCMFREPLGMEDDHSESPMSPAIERWFRGRAPWRSARTVAPRTVRSASGARALLQSARRGVVVVGALECPSERAAVRRVITHLGWPVLADVASCLRTSRARGIVRHSDLVLAAAAGAVPQADLVLRLGGPLVGRRTEEFVALAGAVVNATVGIDPIDPAQTPGVRVEGGAAALESVVARLPRRPQTRHRWWVKADSAARRGLAVWSAALDELAEPWIAFTCARLIGANGTLMVGNSMPIRDLDLTMGADGAGLVAANRGASGIDGLLATAVGHSIGSGRAVCVLLGDLSLLHDLSSLALLRECAAPVSIVVVQNDGGGIFHHLGVSSHRAFERIFATPHGVEFKHAAAMFGLRYGAAKGRSSARGALENELMGASRRGGADARHGIVELRTQRQRAVAIRRDLIAAVSASLRTGTQRQATAPISNSGNPRRARSAAR